MEDSHSSLTLLSMAHMTVKVWTDSFVFEGFHIIREMFVFSGCLSSISRVGRHFLSDSTFEFSRVSHGSCMYSGSGFWCWGLSFLVLGLGFEFFRYWGLSFLENFFNFLFVLVLINLFLFFRCVVWELGI